jgi:hypothetical protein
VDEYEQLHRLGELWTRSIMTWSQISIPLGAGIITIFATQLNTFSSSRDGGDYIHASCFPEEYFRCK